MHTTVLCLGMLNMLNCTNAIHCIVFCWKQNIAAPIFGLLWCVRQALHDALNALEQTALV